MESEMELPFAGLHQLCAPLLDRLDRLPEPQRDALSIAFGLSRGAAPDRFFVGLAVLSLLSDAAQAAPLVVCVDDAQWLDGVSAQARGFVARRLQADPVAVVFATRVTTEALERLPELVVGGLPEADARAVLAAAVHGPLDERVRDRIVSETGGNPLALTELPRGLEPAQLAGGFALPHQLGLSGRIEDSFLRRIDSLGDDTRRLLLLAASDPVGDPALVWRAAATLAIGPDAAGPAEEAELLRLGATVRFRHPLVRSVIYRAAAPAERRAVHRALAGATDPEADPDRRAWHRAHAAESFDEDVALELERSAGRALDRGGLAAAAAFLERAAGLTPDPGRRAARELAAAEAKLQAGAFGESRSLLAAAEAGPLDEHGRWGVASWAGIELIEAAVRHGDRTLAARTLGAFSGRLGGSDWGLGVGARSRALLAEDDGDPEPAYREAIERLERGGVHALRARTQLLYGEWLRRHQRRRDAREQLRVAHEALTNMGLAAFAERAARELRAAGATAVSRGVGVSSRLTPREAEIARFAGEGLSNTEIGTRLFISPRTVEYHLHKVFGKLEIAGRNELARALDGDAAPLA